MRRSIEVGRGRDEMIPLEVFGAVEHVSGVEDTVAAKQHGYQSNLCNNLV